MHLSKSRFTAGLQCHKQLWWKVHEPDAPELVASQRIRSSLTTGWANALARSFRAACSSGACAVYCC